MCVSMEGCHCQGNSAFCSGCIAVASSLVPLLDVELLAFSISFLVFLVEGAVGFEIPSNIVIITFGPMKYPKRWFFPTLPSPNSKVAFTAGGD